MVQATPGLCWSDTVPEYRPVRPPVATVTVAPPVPALDARPARVVTGDPRDLVPLADGEELLAVLRVGPGVRSEKQMVRFREFCDRLYDGWSTASAAVSAGVTERTAMRFNRRLRDGESPVPTELELAVWEFSGRETQSFRSLRLRRASVLPGIVVCSFTSPAGYQIPPTPVAYQDNAVHRPTIDRPYRWADSAGNYYLPNQCGLAGWTADAATEYLKSLDKAS